MIFSFVQNQFFRLCAFQCSLLLLVCHALCVNRVLLPVSVTACACVCVRASALCVYNIHMYFLILFAPSLSFSLSLYLPQSRLCVYAAMCVCVCRSVVIRPLCYATFCAMHGMKLVFLFSSRWFTLIRSSMLLVATSYRTSTALIR